MDWSNFVKKYVWDENRTPYFTRADKLTRSQANSEIFLYAVFIGTLAGAVAAATVRADTLGAPWVAAFALTLVGAAALLGVSKNLYAALYCLGAPAAEFANLIGGGLYPRVESIDKFVLLVFTILWLRYALRVVGIARAYPTMSAGTPAA